MQKYFAESFLKPVATFYALFSHFVCLFSGSVVSVLLLLFFLSVLVLFFVLLFWGLLPLRKLQSFL